MSRNQFRLLVASGWLLSLGCLLVLGFESLGLPPELQNYIEATARKSYDTWAAIIYAVLFVAGAAASVGVLLFKRRARTLYVTTFAVSLALMPTLPPTVMTPWASLFSAVSWLAISSMMLLMYLPPVKEYFNRTKSDFS